MSDEIPKYKTFPRPPQKYRMIDFQPNLTERILQFHMNNTKQVLPLNPLDYLKQRIEQEIDDVTREIHTLKIKADTLLGIRFQIDEIKRQYEPTITATNNNSNTEHNPNTPLTEGTPK